MPNIDWGHAMARHKFSTLPELISWGKGFMLGGHLTSRDIVEATDFFASYRTWPCVIRRELEGFEKTLVKRILIDRNPKAVEFYKKKLENYPYQPIKREPTGVKHG